MKEAGDIAGVTVPFAAGVMTAVYAGAFFHNHIEAAFIPVLCLSVSLIALLHPRRNEYGTALQWTLILICLLSAGVLSGIVSEMISCSSVGAGIFRSTALKGGLAMQEAVDSLCFKNPETNAIIKALITGERCDIPPAVVQSFRDSGASHILALSGMHLGIIYGIVTRLFSIFGNSPGAKILRSVLTVGLCGAYTLATGAAASITRALLFIILAEAAKTFHRSRDLKTVFFSALLIQLTVRPQDAASVGFQLSYAAMAGIAFIFPQLKAFWPGSEEVRTGFFKNRPEPLRWIWNSAALSISCQLTTGPLAWLYFESFPVHFLLTNLIAIPLTGLIIPSALLLLFLNSFGGCPEFLLTATEAMISALSESLAIISTM